MSVKNTEGSNVLSFKRVAKRVSPAAVSVSELNELLIIYHRLIALLRATDNEGLDALTDNLVLSVVRWQEASASAMDENEAQGILKEMKGELREVPRTLRSLLPGIGPRLCESMEQKLKIQFSKY